MVFRNFLIGLSIIAIILLALGCKQQEPESVMNERDQLINICIDACQQALNEGQDLSVGPCLLDPMPNNEWVCDIAHKPRQDIDNKRKNQCNAWHNKTAKHFIELTPECEFITVY